MKSDISDLLEVVLRVYRDACAQCTADVSDLRDEMTISSRVKHEGLSFLTITLPNFVRDFEQSIEVGGIGPEHFRMFRKYRGIPVFLRGILVHVFDCETGRIYDKDRHFATNTSSYVRAIRQIGLLLKKVEVSCTPARDAAAVSNFVDVESSIGVFELPEEERGYYRRVSSVLWDNTLYPLDISVFNHRHGPGATADRISGNQKFTWRRWHERLEDYFPLAGNGYLITDDIERTLEGVTFVPPDQEQPVRVTLVPKTLKGPRIIAIEPHCMQFVQQGIRSAIYNAIESSPRLSGHINFRDQSVNQSLAMSSSNDGQLATIDLSDASDRVPCDLAMDMFRSNPDLRDAILACRSTRAELPDGTVIGPLRKFASMGSALCFPVESMYFYTICVVALLREHNLPVTHEAVDYVAPMIHVYGDDIIVPSANAVSVLDHLQKYNCKVNYNKTFRTGRFRESCGVDAFDGDMVTPVYVRQLQPKNRQQVSRIVSWVKTATQFYQSGYQDVAEYMYTRVERLVGKLPTVSENSPALGRFSYTDKPTIHRWNAQYQRAEVNALIPTPVYRTDVLEGDGALFKSLSKLTDLENLWEYCPELKPLYRSRDPLHLKRSALHGEAALHRRWVPVT